MGSPAAQSEFSADGGGKLNECGEDEGHVCPSEGGKNQRCRTWLEVLATVAIARAS